MQRHPFSAVLHWLVRAAESPGGAIVLSAETVDLIRRHRVRDWL